MAASAILIAVESEMSPSPRALGANTKNSTPHRKTAAAKRSRLRPTTRKKGTKKNAPLPRCRRLRGGGGLQEREPRGRFASCAARCKRDKEGGIPPTKYRAADGGCRAREAKRLRAVAGRRARRKTKVVPPNATRVPCAVCFAAEAERSDSGRGGLRRTATRSCICILRAVAWTRRTSGLTS